MTPRSFSSSVSVAVAAANGLSATPATLSPALRAALMALSTACCDAVTTCTFEPRRTPDIPIGSRTPLCPSTRNSCGTTSTTTRPDRKRERARGVEHGG